MNEEGADNFDVRMIQLADAVLNLLLGVSARNLDAKFGTPRIGVSRRELQNVRRALDTTYPGVLEAARQARQETGR